MKRTQVSIAALVKRGDDERFLAVRRPEDDDRLPGVWGLPAVTLHPGELPEDGLRRVGREKLGTDLEPVRMMGALCADRGEYTLLLLDIEARLLGREPDVGAATTAATRYVAQQWTNDLELLVPAARMGSLCCRIVLDAAGRSY